MFPQDNCFINGTKLLNVANMTRGRRDGLLKSEKNRKVVKIGPMHLKGVWCVDFSILSQGNHSLTVSQDSLRPCSRLCQQGKDYRCTLSSFRPQCRGIPFTIWLSPSGICVHINDYPTPCYSSRVWPCPYKLYHVTSTFFTFRQQFSQSYALYECSPCPWPSLA